MPLLLAAPLAPQFNRGEAHAHGGILSLAAAVVLAASVVTALAMQSYAPA